MVPEMEWSMGLFTLPIVVLWFLYYLVYIYFIKPEREEKLRLERENKQRK